MQIDLEQRDAVERPADYFGEARAGGPVQWSDVHRAWLVLGHAECSEAFRDGERLSTDRITALERLAADRPAAFAKVVELLRGWMIFRDPPAHTRLRGPVRNVFSPRSVESLTGMIERTIADVLGRLPESGEFQVVRDFSGPLPALVIATILGVDDAGDRARFPGWSDDLATIVFTTQPSSTPPDQAIAATEQFERFFGTLIEADRVEPRGGLLTHLIAEADDDLTPMELIGACTLMLFAGHETTTSLLTNTIGLVLERPELLDGLRSCDDDAVAVDELLRVVGPARTMFRKAAVDHERGGQQIRAGDTVAIVIAAANHDPAVYDDPGRVDFGRSPNPHFAFGWGLHHCVGANLARLEARLALRALLDRYEHIEPVGDLPPVRGTVLGYARGPITVRVA